MTKHCRGWEPPSLNGVRVKVSRAHLHLSSLNSRFDKLVDNNAYRFKAEVRPNLLEHVYRADNPPPVDPEWSAMVGDCVHNLRTALDHLAWQLVRASGANHPPKNTKFPINDWEPGTRRSCLPWRRVEKPAWIAGHLQPEMWRLIEEVQPYKRRDESKHLRTLREFDNFDKHAQLVVVAAAVHVASSSGPVDPDGQIIGGYKRIKFTGLPIEHDQVVARVFYPERKPEPEPNLSFTPFVVLKGEPAPGEILGMGLLPRLIQFVELDFIPRFEPAWESWRLHTLEARMELCHEETVPRSGIRMN